MPDTSPFRVVASDLLAHPGEERRETIRVPVDYRVELAGTLPDPPLEADVRLRGVTGGVSVHGDARFVVRIRCTRCLTESDEERRVRFSELLTDDLDEADYRLDGDVADLEPVIRDAVTLALPLAPLCREDCAGLCATCGADLNSGACEGHGDEIESPFAGLIDLLETQE